MNKNISKSQKYTTMRLLRDTSTRLREISIELYSAPKEIITDHILKFGCEYFNKYGKLPEMKDLENLPSGAESRKAV